MTLPSVVAPLVAMRLVQARADTTPPVAMAVKAVKNRVCLFIVVVIEVLWYGPVAVALLLCKITKRIVFLQCNAPLFKLSPADNYGNNISSQFSYQILRCVDGSSDVCRSACIATGRLYAYGQVGR